MLRRPLLLLAIVLGGCTAPGEGRGTTIVFASGADLQGMNPLITTHPLARQVQRHVLLTTLVRHDSTMALIPYLARSWVWSPDSQRVTMSIFPRLNWHDGRPTTAHDVVWTIEAARDPAVGFPRHSELAAFAGVHAADDSTVVLSFAAPQTAIPDVLADLAILPRHLFEAGSRTAMRQAAWNEEPIGNGPFRFVRHEPNRRWVFDAVDGFPAELGGRARIDRLVVAVVDEPTTKLAALTSGELDFAGINPAHATFVARRPTLAVVDYPLLFTYVLVFNSRRTALADRAVREAIATAIDRDGIVAGYLFGFGTPSSSPVPPPLAGSGSTVPRSDVQRARELLGGRRVTIEMLTVGSGDAPLEQMLQAQLARVGIEVKIRQLELGSMLDRVYGEARDFDVAVMGVAGDASLGHLRALAALSGLPLPASQRDLQAMIADSVPFTVLYHARGLQGMNRRVRGVQMDMRGELASIRQWSVE